MNRLIGAAAAMAVLTLGGIAGAQTPVKGGVMNMGSLGAPNTLDCTGIGSSTQLIDIAPGYSTLLRYDPENYPAIVGDLAASWEMAPDRMSYTFKLVPNVKFHDGSALTSADVKASYERMKTPPAGVTSLRANLYTAISTIETPDPLTVVFKLSRPDPALVLNFANPYGCIYAAAKLAQNPKYPETEIMGTGPFKMTEFVPGASITFVRNPNYFHSEQPYLDGIKGVFLTTQGLVTAISGGQLDMVPNQMTPAGRDNIVATRGNKVTVQEAPFNVTNMVDIAVNRDGPLKDVRVRRALNLALDRRFGDAVMQKSWSAKGFGVLFPAGSPWDMSTDEMYKLPGYGPDVVANRAEAKKLLAEAGQSNLKLVLLSRNVGEPYTSLGVYVVDQFRQIGVTVEQNIAETGAYYTALSSQNYQIAIDANSSISPDPNEVLLKFLPNSSTNFTGAKDQELQDLFDKQATETDAAKRKELVTAFQKRMVDQAYLLPMFRSISIAVQGANVHGYRLMPSPTMNNDMRAVWMDKQ